MTTNEHSESTKCNCNATFSQFRKHSESFNTWSGGANGKRSAKPLCVPMKQLEKVRIEMGPGLNNNNFYRRLLALLSVLGPFWTHTHRVSDTVRWGHYKGTCRSSIRILKNAGMVHKGYRAELLSQNSLLVLIRS